MAKKSEKKELLLDCTMRAVAENGLLAVSMQMVTKMASTAEGLIYKHFQTKENLLLECYLSLYREIREKIESGIAQGKKARSKEEMFSFLREIWKKYFYYLVSNPYKAKYFYEYRNSAYMKSAAEAGKIDPKNFFFKTVELFTLFDEKFKLFGKIDMKWFFYYVADLSIVFAIRVINEGKECDEKMIEHIWNLVWGGESYLVDNERKEG